MVVVVSVADESPSVESVQGRRCCWEATASVGFTRLNFLQVPSLVSRLALLRLSGENEMDNSPMRCVVTGTVWRGSRYVKVPEFQSLK